MKRVQLIFAVLLVVHLSPAVAQETIRLAVGEWPPYLSETLPHQGIAAQIIRDAFAMEGYDVTFDFLPWARAYKEAMDGRYDGTAVWLKTAEREADFYYSAPVIQEEHAFFYLKTFPFDWNRVEDLHGVSFGGLIGFSYGDAFDTALKSGALTMDRAGSDGQNFGKLLMGRIEVYPQEIQVGYHAMRMQISPEKARLITHHPRLFLIRFSHLLLSKEIKRNKELIDLFNRGLRCVKARGNGPSERVPSQR